MHRFTFCAAVALGGCAQVADSDPANIDYSYLESASPGDATACTDGASGALDMLNFELMNAEIEANPHLAELAGIEKVRTCADARAYLRTREEFVKESGELDQGGDGWEQVEPEESVQKIKGGIVANMPGIVDLGNCTGALISPDVIVTAAHCLPAGSGRARWTIFRFDWNGKEKITETAELLEYARHPDYPGGVVTKNDIGFIKRIGKRFTGVASGYIFQTEQKGIYEGLQVRVWGRGFSGFHGEGSGTLRFGRFDIDWRNYDYANTRGTSTTRMCRGDSGGPVTTEGGKLLAINSNIDYDTSGNGNCSGPGYKQRHTRLNWQNFAWMRDAAGLSCHDWIDDDGNKLMACD